MLPGFIDSHSHITGLASTMALVPLNGAKSFEDIINRMKEFKRTYEARRKKNGLWDLGTTTISFEEKGIRINMSWTGLTRNIQCLSAMHPDIWV